jgi:hypothetical protein
MKKLMLGFALLVASQAQAHIASPVWTCKLKAKVTGHQQVELLLFRGETATAAGTVSCHDAFGHKVNKNVNVTLHSGGVGPAINGPLDSLVVKAVTVGLATPEGMVGTYQLAAGPRLGLLDARVGVMGGVQVAGHGVGAQIDLVIENRNSFGIDVGALTLEVRPAAGRVKAKF